MSLTQMQKRIDFVRNQFAKRTEPGQLDSALSIATSIDPTKNGAFLGWIVKLVTSGQEIKAEIANDILSSFVTLRNKVKGLDINQFESIDQIKQFIDDHNQKLIDQSTKMDLRWSYPANDKGYVMLYDGPEGRLVVPLTYEASAHFGSGSRWCTTQTEALFKIYHDQGNLYIWMPKGGTKHQIWIDRTTRSGMQVSNASDGLLFGDQLTKWVKQSNVTKQLFKFLIAIPPSANINSDLLNRLDMNYELFGLDHVRDTIEQLTTKLICNPSSHAVQLSSWMAIPCVSQAINLDDYTDLLKANYEQQFEARISKLPVAVPPRSPYSIDTIIEKVAGHDELVRLCKHAVAHDNGPKRWVVAAHVLTHLKLDDLNEEDRDCIINGVAKQIIDGVNVTTECGFHFFEQACTQAFVGHNREYIKTIKSRVANQLMTDDRFKLAVQIIKGIEQESKVMTFPSTDPIDLYVRCKNQFEHELNLVELAATLDSIEDGYKSLLHNIVELGDLGSNVWVSSDTLYEPCFATHIYLKHYNNYGTTFNRTLSADIYETDPETGFVYLKRDEKPQYPLESMSWRSTKSGMHRYSDRPLDYWTSSILRHDSIYRSLIQQVQVNNNNWFNSIIPPIFDEEFAMQQQPVIIDSLSALQREGRALREQRQYQIRQPKRRQQPAYTNLMQPFNRTR